MPYVKSEFSFADVPCQGPDLFVEVTPRGDELSGQPSRTPRLMWVGIASPLAQLVSAEPPVTGMRLRGKVETAIDVESAPLDSQADKTDGGTSQPRFVTASKSGASVRWSPRSQLGDLALPAYQVHPPYRGGTGYTFWQRDVDVPEEGQLEFFTGMGVNARAQ